ncbi:O-antigen ligase family protein [Flavobacterium marginilacus]|uniref:O-antigen ligase family protein n=1 Tax=Flavobacterium marginilacus TaxID=3003256 RepID=UPI00248F3D20|nr:O-antigen ligase family protein [Flavobacterium marginilacus]
MKAIFFLISYILILIVSLINCSSENLPFLKEDYIYWIFILTPVALFFNPTNKTLKINIHDTILILLAIIGTIHFIIFSKATIYNTTIWCYIGYLVIYLLLRTYSTATEVTKKILIYLLYFCTSTAVLNIFWMFLQWKHLVSSPNEFFLTTGLFFSPNQLGIYLSIGCLSSLYLFQKAKNSLIKTGLGLSLLLILIGVCISESRGAFISLCTAIGYYFYHSKIKMKSPVNWKTTLVIGILIVSSLYFVTAVNKNKAESNSGRYFTTKQVIQQIAKNPLGYGVNSFSSEYNKLKAQYFDTNSNWEEMKNAGYIYNANNDFLELTFELGILWILPFLVFIVLLFRKKENTIEIQIARTILICLLVFSLTNNILTLPIFPIITCICTVIIINTTNPKVIYECKNRTFYKLITIGLILSFAIIQINRINAEYKLYKLYKDKLYLKGENQLKGYLSKIDNKGEELFMGGIILIKNGYKKESTAYIKTGFERSGKPSFGRILANGLKKQKQYTLAETIYTYNKNVEPYRYEARVDLFDLFLETNQKAKAKKMALEIINLPIKIHSASIIGFKKKAKLYLKKYNNEQTKKSNSKF